MSELTINERLSIACTNLQVSIALTGMIMESWPDHVQANYMLKVESIIGNITREVDEIHGFGEAFDDEADHSS